jgi:hypothetical protein
MAKQSEQSETNYVGQSASSRRRSRALQIVYGEKPVVRLDPNGPLWEVPSETQGTVTYLVNLDRISCECAYYRDTRRVCKHIEAARIVESARQLEVNEHGEIRSVPNPYKNAAYYERLKRVEDALVTQIGMLLIKHSVGLLNKEGKLDHDAHA